MLALEDDHELIQHNDAVYLESSTAIVTRWCGDHLSNHGILVYRAREFSALLWDNIRNNQHNAAQHDNQQSHAFHHLVPLDFFAESELGTFFRRAVSSPPHQ